MNSGDGVGEWVGTVIRLMAGLSLLYATGLVTSMVVEQRHSDGAVGLPAELVAGRSRAPGDADPRLTTFAHGSRRQPAAALPGPEAAIDVRVRRMRESHVAQPAG